MCTYKTVQRTATLESNPMIDVTILGTGGMLPTANRHLSSALVRNEGRIALIDCGEGTQVAFQSYGWTLHRIDLILLTHLHADHVLGLPGLLITMANQGRKDPLTIVGPEHTLHVVRSLSVITPLTFRVNLLELPKVTGLQLGNMAVTAVPMDHDIPCFGYRFDLPRPRKFLPGRALELGIPQELWSKLQANETVRKGFKRWTPDQVLGPKREGLSLMYATDTRPNENLLEASREVDLLICEGIYGVEDKDEEALRKGHMSVWQALELAQKAGVKECWLTHFSPSFIDQEKVAPRIEERSGGFCSFAFDGRSTTLEYVGE